jgi:hypothetical protein
MRRANPFARWPALAACAAALAGCLGPLNIGATRLDAQYIVWPGYDYRQNDKGTALGIELARGTDTDPAFGPIYFGLAYSYAALEMGGYDDTHEHRLGTRWRSSMLDHTSSSYAYATGGVFLGWIEPGDERGGRLGAGVEGGYGVRAGLGPHAALDLDVTFTYAFYDGRYEQLSTRLGGALVARY